MEYRTVPLVIDKSWIPRPAPDAAFFTSKVANHCPTIFTSFVFFDIRVFRKPLFHLGLTWLQTTGCKKNFFSAAKYSVADDKFLDVYCPRRQVIKSATRFWFYQLSSDTILSQNNADFEEQQLYQHDLVLYSRERSLVRIAWFGLEFALFRWNSRRILSQYSTGVTFRIGHPDVFFAESTFSAHFRLTNWLIIFLFF